MDIILIPGLWLDASTWDAVTPHLEQAGHRVQALTLPGMTRDADRSEVTLADQVEAIVAAIDDLEGPVVLVGHSAGCALAHAAVDARPDRVAHVVHVGGFPNPDGEPLLPGLPAEGGEVPMPDWVALGEEANVADFDDELLEEFYAAAIPAPLRVLEDPVSLSDDERRFYVPATMVCPEYSAEDLQHWLAEGEEGLSELARIEDVDYVDLPGGHWPQVTQPEALARIILDVVAAIR